MVNFKTVIKKIVNGYIAVVTKASPEREMRQVAEFSRTTTEILGLSGHNERLPLIELGSWWDEPESEPTKMHVFVLVVNDEMVGYMPIRWHCCIERHGETLDTQKKPTRESGSIRIYSANDFMNIDFSDRPKQLESWGVVGICIIPEWQRKGFGTLLLKTGTEYLGTNEKDVAYAPPLTDSGKALVKSLGLNPEDLYYCPGRC